MFPYLKRISDFIRDCETVNAELSLCRSTGQYELISHFKTKESRPQDSCTGDCSGCKGIPSLVTALIRNVDASNWGSDTANGLGTVSFSEVRAWCQSVCVSLYEVLKPLEDMDLVVGLEYYLETRKGFGLDKKNHYRVDVIIGGYGTKFGNPEGRLLVIEQKQYNDVRWSNTGEEITWTLDSKSQTVESPCRQVKFYCDNICESLNSKKISPYSVIPCVFMNNMTKKGINNEYYPELDKDHAEGLVVDNGVMFEGRPVNIFICGDPKDRYKTFRNHITELFNYEGNDRNAIDVFRELKKEYRKLTQDEIGDILVCEDAEIEERFKSILRPDQFFTMYGYENNTGWDNYLKKHIDLISFFNDLENRKYWGPQKYGIIDMIEGGPGSGKTILAMLILRYCLMKNLSVLYAYSGSAPVNRIFGYLADLLSEQTQGEAQGGRSRFVESVNSLPAGKLQKFKIFRSYKDRKKFDIAGFSKIPENMDYDVYIIDDAHIDKEIYLKTRATKSNVEILRELEESKKLVFMLYDRHQILDEPNTNSDGSKENAYHELLRDLAQDNPDRNAFRDHNAFHLWSMYRCNGDEGYLTWIEKTLGIEPYSKKAKSNLFDFDVKIIDKEELQDLAKKMGPSDDVLFLTELSDENRASEILGRPAVIYSGVNGLMKPVTDKGDINLGRALKIRGVETGRAVVIIDDGIRFENGKVTGDDNLKKKYRILLTRGLRECYIYAMDPELAKQMKESLEKCN